MPLLIPIIAAGVACNITAVAFWIVFRNLQPSMISGYKACRGNWNEALLNNCAAGLLKIPQQPVNTYTNLAYLAGGFFLAFKLATLPSFIIAFALLYLCVGSAFYHATSTWWAGNLDLSAMYAVFSSLAVYAISTVTGGADALVALIMFCVAVLLGYLLRWVVPGSVDLKIGIALVITYGVSMWGLSQRGMSVWDRNLIISFVLFLLAFGAWFLDKRGLFPFKRWGHGVWHLLTAAAISLLFHCIHMFR